MYGAFPQLSSLWDLEKHERNGGGGPFKLINLGGNESLKRDSFYREEGFHYVILLYCETLL